MKSIGGNVTAQLQIRTTAKNTIGEGVKAWETVQSLLGFLDYAGGEANRTSFNTKLQESTHVFICDYVQLDSRVNENNSRLLIGSDTYDVTLIDNPMNLNKHLEFMLKYTGV